MRSFKLFSVIAVAVLLLAPASMFAKSHFSFSLNMFDRGICMAPPPPPVIVEAPPLVFVPAPTPVYEPPTIVNEYHQHYYSTPKQVRCPSPYYSETSYYYQY